MPEWRAIVGYEGLYEVSDEGQVRSLRRSLVMSAYVTNAGYTSAMLRRDGRYRHHLVSRMVCEAFHGSPRQGAEACHNDGDKTNNAASNLRWGSRKDNCQDGIRHGSYLWKNRTSVKLLSEGDVRTIRAIKSDLGLSCNEIAKMFSVNRRTIGKIVARQRWANVA